MCRVCALVHRYAISATVERIAQEEARQLVILSRCHSRVSEPWKTLPQPVADFLERRREKAVEEIVGSLDSLCGQRQLANGALLQEVEYRVGPIQCLQPLKLRIRFELRI